LSCAALMTTQTWSIRPSGDPQFDMPDLEVPLKALCLFKTPGKWRGDTSRKNGDLKNTATKNSGLLFTSSSTSFLIRYSWQVPTHVHKAQTFCLHSQHGEYPLVPRLSSNATKPSRWYITFQQFNKTRKMYHNTEVAGSRLIIQTLFVCNRREPGRPWDRTTRLPGEPPPPLPTPPQHYHNSQRARVPTLSENFTWQLQTLGKL
jgi:hypothetical protein